MSGEQEINLLDLESCYPSHTRTSCFLCSSWVEMEENTFTISMEAFHLTSIPGSKSHYQSKLPATNNYKVGGGGDMKQLCLGFGQQGAKIVIPKREKTHELILPISLVL